LKRRSLNHEEHEAATTKTAKKKKESTKKRKGGLVSTCNTAMLIPALVFCEGRKGSNGPDLSVHGRLPRRRAGTLLF
jgi:hypothetical protein